MVLLYRLLHLQLHLLIGDGENHWIISLMYLVSSLGVIWLDKGGVVVWDASFTNLLSLQLRRIQMFFLDSSKGFLCANFKLQRIPLVTKIFLVEVDLVRFIKDA